MLKTVVKRGMILMRHRKDKKIKSIQTKISLVPKSHVTDTQIIIITLIGIVHFYFCKSLNGPPKVKNDQSMDPVMDRIGCHVTVSNKASLYI